MFKKKLLFLLPALIVLVLAAPAYGAPVLAFLDKPVVDIFNDAIEWLLSIVGGLTLAMLIFGGIYYIFSGSSPEGQNTAKKIITYAILGLGLILVSYAILGIIKKVATEETISITNSSVSPNSGPPGTNFTIKATITSPKGVNASTVIAHIQNPDETDIDTVLLVDNGTGVDALAGDDIYTGEWTSIAVGSYFVDIRACDNTGNCAEDENI